MTNPSAEEIQKEFDQFVYVTSHDLAAPVRAMSGYASLLKNKYSDQLDEEGNLFLENILKSSKNFQNLMEGLLAYSRLVTKINIIENVDLNKIITEVKNPLSKQITESGAKINHDNFPTISCDENQIRMIFTNLIDNAIKFCQPDKKPEINITVKEQKDSYEFCISDNGIGIEPKYFDQIFVIFRKLHLESKYEGSGVGLALCKKAIQLHNGAIWLESEPDIGSKFYFTLPR